MHVVTFGEKHLPVLQPSLKTFQYLFPRKWYRFIILEVKAYFSQIRRIISTEEVETCLLVLHKNACLMQCLMLVLKNASKNSQFMEEEANTSTEGDILLLTLADTHNWYYLLRPRGKQVLLVFISYSNYN